MVKIIKNDHVKGETRRRKHLQSNLKDLRRLNCKTFQNFDFNFDLFLSEWPFSGKSQKTFIG